MSDCAICSDEITATTGRSIMGCGHEFHMKCLVQWLQKPDGSGSCPCCRREPGEMERLVKPMPSEDDDDDDDDDDDLSNVGDVTPLMIAARDGNTDEVRRLLAEGAPVNARDSDGDTALQWAEYDDICILLLEAGADATLIRGSDTAGDEPRTAETALMAACEHDSAPCCVALIERGANVNYADPQTGTTPLMMAVQSESSIMIVDQLLQKGANIFAVDHNGWNAFMWFACSSDDVDVMTLLLRAAGPAFRPKVVEARAVKKIQSVWRGWKVRRHRVVIERKDNWIMRRMMAVQ